MPRVNFDVDEDLNSEFKKVLNRESENKSKVLRALMRAYIEARENSDKAHSEIIRKIENIE